jgi:hypothetical protein
MELRKIKAVVLSPYSIVPSHVTPPTKQMMVSLTIGAGFVCVTIATACPDQKSTLHQ